MSIPARIVDTLDKDQLEQVEGLVEICMSGEDIHEVLGTIADEDVVQAVVARLGNNYYADTPLEMDDD